MNNLQKDLKTVIEHTVASIVRERFLDKRVHYRYNYGDTIKLDANGDYVVKEVRFEFTDDNPYQGTYDCIFRLVSLSDRPDAYLNIKDVDDINE